MFALLICFVVSGATSLILQVVWVRKLTEVFGSSTLAISTVLATFMAGLALGSWLGGKLADATQRAQGRSGWSSRLMAEPIFLYAGCEALVAVVALGIPTVVATYRPINAILWSSLGEMPAVLALARFGLAAAVLLVPTTAMGATLPLLGRHVTRKSADLTSLPRRLGALYAANTAGAVVGAGLAGFALLPTLGASATNRLAAALAASLAAVIAVVTVLRLRRPEAAVPPVAAPELEAGSDQVPRPALPQAHRRLALWAYAISGATAMALEVLWSRALAVVIGSSVYSFTLILVVFLIGLSIGAAAISKRAQRTERPLALLGWLFSFTALAIVLTHLVVDDLPVVFLALVEGGQLDAGSMLTVHTVLAGLVILPGAVGLGAVMPVCMRAYVGDLNAVGRDVGRAYAANTVGAIIGSLVGGIALLPMIGIERGVLLCAAIYAAGAAALLWVGKTRRPMIATVAIGLAMLAVGASPRWNQSDFTSGLFRTHLARHYLARGGLSERNVVYYQDGIATTVSVETHDGLWVLKNNGKTEASNQTDMPTQILVGLLPVLLHDEDEVEVFTVGYGSGVTIGAIAQAPQVTRIDVVELEPKVLEAADRFFGPFNRDAHRDPKVHRFVGDGRDVLLAGGKRYDVIVSEPSNPWMAGVSTLFTREFYAFAKRHLAPGGIYCQWAQLYELGARNVKMIYATFAEAFPYVYAFTPGDGTSDTILIGSMQPLTLDLAQLAARMKDPTLASELRRAEVETPEELAASLFLGPGDIPAFTAGADINTDDNARLEYAAPLDLLSENRARLAREIRTIGWPYGRLADIVDLGRDPGESAVRLAFALVGYGRYREARIWAERADGALADTARLVIDLALPVDYADPELPVTAGGPPLSPPSPEVFTGTADERTRAMGDLIRAYGHLAEGEWRPAWLIVRDLPVRRDTDAGLDLHLLRGYLAYKAIELKRARSILNSIDSEGLYARRPALRYYLARNLLGLGKFDEGAQLMRRFVTDHPALAKQAARSRLGTP